MILSLAYLSQIILVELLRVSKVRKFSAEVVFSISTFIVWTLNRDSFGDLLLAFDFSFLFAEVYFLKSILQKETKSFQKIMVVFSLPYLILVSNDVSSVLGFFIITIFIKYMGTLSFSEKSSHGVKEGLVLFLANTLSFLLMATWFAVIAGEDSSIESFRQIYLSRDAVGLATLSWLLFNLGGFGDSRIWSNQECEKNGVELFVSFVILPMVVTSLFSPLLDKVVGYSPIVLSVICLFVLIINIYFILLGNEKERNYSILILNTCTIFIFELFSKQPSPAIVGGLCGFNLLLFFMSKKFNGSLLVSYVFYNLPFSPIFLYQIHKINNLSFHGDKEVLFLLVFYVFIPLVFMAKVFHRKKRYYGKV